MRTFDEVHSRDVADRAGGREHQLKLEQLEYQHVARENDAERAVEQRLDLRSLLFASGIITLLVVVSMTLIFAGHGDVAAQVVKDAVIFAAGLGVGQTRPVRALLGPRRRTSDTKKDGDEEHSA